MKTKQEMLEKEGYTIGQIICVSGHTHNPKRVIFSQRLGGFALQNLSERNQNSKLFFDFTEEENRFWGSLDDCFLLPLNAKEKITVIGFQEVPEANKDAAKKYLSKIGKKGGKLSSGRGLKLLAG